MPTAAHAAAQAAPCPLPQPAAGVRARAGGLRVRVPLRLVVGAQYCDAALSVYIKVSALAMRPEGCTARVGTLADYLGLPRRTVERGLSDLIKPDPADGVTEVVTTRRTARGGTGESALRTVRPMAADELFVWVPVRAAEALTPRQLRVYALIAYAEIRRIPLALGDVGEILHHRTGKHAGEALSGRQVDRLVTEVETAGWITVHRRQGSQGRHAYEAHRTPLHLVTDPPPATPAPGEDLQAGPDTSGGSGPRTCGGSLTNREDHRTDSPDETQVDGGIRRRRDTGKWGTPPVENPSPTGNAAPGGRAYGGPALQLGPHVWRVLDPVRHLLPELSPYVLRRVARDIGSQLDAGATEERLHARLTRRYATTDTILDLSGWLLGAALVRHGCGLDVCESGRIWHTGHDCHVCLDNALHRDVLTATEPPPPTDDTAPPPAAPAPPVPLPVPRAEANPVSDEERTRARATATAQDVTRFLQQHGRRYATDLYGWRLVALAAAPTDPGEARAQ